MDKDTIADVLSEIGQLLELKGENPFKIRAYQNGARALESLEEDLDMLIEQGRLEDVQGIGKALVEKITALRQTGELAYYDKLKASVPAGLVEMLDLSGVGPKKIKALHEELGIETIDALAQACREGRVAALDGFGKKSEEKILQAIQNREAYSRRHLWWSAQEVAMPILEGLRELKEVERAEVAGSLRRGKETVGDLDFLAASTDSGPIMAWFTQREEVAEVLAKGETKSSVRFRGGLQADLRVVPPERFAFALHHFTGSKEHNVKMRQRALSRGYSLSEWGLFPLGKGESADVEEPGGPPQDRASEKAADERTLFELLGLHFIPPELREDHGEIAAAEQGELPRLIEERDIRGVFHNHTNASDGRATLEQMARAAGELGFEYLGIADHSKASFQANGLDEGRLREQLEKIRALNRAGELPVHLFAGVECDILGDGSLDLEEDLLAELDYVVVSVHAQMTQDEATMTRRIIRALEHPCTTMLGHLTGRLLLRREGYRVDVAKIIDAAAANGKLIEFNASPMRLEMDWRHWRRAAEKGVLCAINPDAHSAEQLGYFRLGVRQARKGWLTPEQVLNTRPRSAVAKVFGCE